VSDCGVNVGNLLLSTMDPCFRYAACNTEHPVYTAVILSQRPAWAWFLLL